MAITENKVKQPAPLQAQTKNQKAYLKKLKTARHDILVVTGPAGSGKSYMAMRTAIEQFQNGTYDKIIITRPTVSSGDEDYGYLPGSLLEKLSPWCIPLLDIAKECYSPQQVEQLLVREEMELAPLGFMRGRTLKKAFVVVDEAQNCSADQLRMIMTRLGEGSRMVITGDMEQIDLRAGQSGLVDFVRRLEERDAARQSLPLFLTGSEPLIGDERRDRIGYVRLGRQDVVRHPVIDEILDLYDDAD